MVHLDWKSSVLEVAMRPLHFESEILDDAKKAVHVVVRVDRGKLVGADMPDVKVSASGACRRFEVRGGFVSHFRKGTLQRLPSGGALEIVELR
jgi:hypothetical protein